MPAPFAYQLKNQLITFSFVAQWILKFGLRSSGALICPGFSLRPFKTSLDLGSLFLGPPKRRLLWRAFFFFFFFATMWGHLEGKKP